MTTTPDAPPTSRRTKPATDQPSQDIHLNIYQAILAASVNFGSLEKDSENPYLKSKYLSLAALFKAVRPALTDQGVLITGCIRLLPQGWVIETTLVHVLTGEKLESQFPVEDTSPQKIGSTRTYGERYNLLQLLGIAAADDDGNSAAGLADPGDFLGPPPSGQQRTEPRRLPTNDQPPADWL